MVLKPEASGFLSCLLPDKLLARCHDDRDPKDYEEDRYDELQPLDHEDAGACGECLHEGDEALDQGRECDDQHDYEWRYERPHLPSCDLEEYAERYEHERAQQLVRASEERPDIRVSYLREDVAEDKRDERRYVFVAEQLPPACGIRHVIGAEELLE